MAEEQEEPFEALYRRLEETVARLEEGGLTLEESLRLYEEGTKLAHRCQEMLRDAEIRVKRLQESFGEGQPGFRESPETYFAEAEPSLPEDDLP